MHGTAYAVRRILGSGLRQGDQHGIGNAMDFEDILAADPDRAIMLAHVPIAHRAALIALWRLDLRGAEIVRSTTEAMIGRMRLTWWYEALGKLDSSEPPAEPLLEEVAAALVGAGVAGSALGEALIGWEALLDPMPLDADALNAFAAERGAGLFGVAAGLLGGAAGSVSGAGKGWALVDAARHLTDTESRARALDLAAPLLAEALSVRWPRALRPLGMLARFAEDDRCSGLAAGRAGSPRRMLRGLGFRLAGR
ncbi:phytoene synthase [Sphingomonas zeicaulis]|uniref:squalene/phytoene synthase family protein n=1 Tax=Sphingomonas zeicaulis TaxID=1632740 RepID=UPI003D241CDE